MTLEQTICITELMNQVEILSIDSWDDDDIKLTLMSNTDAQKTIVILSNGDQQWFLNDRLHREDGPAIIRSNGTVAWYLNNRLHREDGPTAIWSDGSQHWWLNGEKHRQDGPADIWADGSQSWYLNGFKMSKRNHNLKTTLKSDDKIKIKNKSVSAGGFKP